MIDHIVQFVQWATFPRDVASPESKKTVAQSNGGREEGI